MIDDVGYVENGLDGVTCADCKYFKPNADDSAMGKCLDYDVSAAASCNYFYIIEEEQTPERRNKRPVAGCQ